MEGLIWLGQATGRFLVVSGIGAVLGILIGLWYVRRDQRRRSG